MRVICINSLKGGTGKSSITIMLANALAAMGFRVLVIDMDLNNSSSATLLLGVEHTADWSRRNIASALQGEKLNDHIVKSNISGVDILPSSLYIVDFRTVPQNRLSRLMPTIEGAYDIVLIDTAPSYDNITLCAMEAATIIVTPVLLTQFDFNTSCFLKGKLQTDNDFYSKWKLLYNGYDKRFETFKSSSQKDYRDMFEAEFDNFLPLSCAIPWTSAVRRYIDRGEKITRTKNEKLFYAVCNLARELSGLTPEQIGSTPEAF